MTHRGPNDINVGSHFLVFANFLRVIVSTRKLNINIPPQSSPHPKTMMARAMKTNGTISSLATNNSRSSNNNPPHTFPTTTVIPPVIRAIPGTYGWPVLGPLRDRLDYFWFQGSDDFFKKRMEKYKSTVFRTNMPPCFPFFSGVNPNVIAVLDCESFSHLFDMEIIEKKNVLVGDFMPSVSYTGNLRVCVYLDTAEEKHAKVKSFVLDLLRRSSRVWVTSLVSSLDTMWSSIDETLSTKGKASYLIPLQKFLFTFLTKALIGADPGRSSSPRIANSGYRMLDEWVALQLLPTQGIGKLLQPLEEVLFHSFAYPFWLVKRNYNELLDFLLEEGEEVVRRGEEEFGLSREECVHNLLFTLGFNAYGGFSVFLPRLLAHLGRDKTGLQIKLREEVRSKVTTPSSLTFGSINQMPLLQSCVYESLRLNPPVPIQYGRARKDFRLSSHDFAFDVKKGELLCGYQKLVMRDPKVFYDPEAFVPDRFVGEQGKQLLNYLYWSNGPETESPSPANKQCPAKDFVPSTACLFVADLFLRYDSIACNSFGEITAAARPQ